MYCMNCGKQCNSNEKYCTNCGAKLDNVILFDNNLVNQQNNVDDNKTANKLATISAICLALPFIFSSIIGMIETHFSGLGEMLSMITGLAFLAGITLMIYIRIKYPNNLLGKILMWICIVGFILFIIFLIIAIISCAILSVTFIESLKSCSG